MLDKEQGEKAAGIAGPVIRWDDSRDNALKLAPDKILAYAKQYYASHGLELPADHWEHFAGFIDDAVNDTKPIAC